MPSGAVQVGALVINMSADIATLKGNMAEGVRAVDSSAKIMVNSMTGVTESSDRATDAGARLVAQLKNEIATFGMTSQELNQHKANLNGVGAEVQALQARLKGMQSAEEAFKTSVEDASVALKAHGAEARVASGHADGFSFATAGAKRELLVLAHELSQGNYKKFGGSMLVLGEQTGAAGLLFSVAGIAAIGLGAALLGVTVALAHGASEQKAMNDALVMTGNYAGLTSDSLNGLAHAAVTSGGSIGEAKKAVTDLAASGKFTGDQIGSVAGAVIALEHATGASIDETIKQFETLAVQAQGHSARASTAISQATVKLDEQYHFLTLSVYDQITALEKEGDLKGASKVATEEFARVTKERAEEIIGNLGHVAKAWNFVKEGIGGAVDAVKEWGAKSTAASEVARLTTKLYGQGAQVDNTAFGRDQRGVEIANLAYWQGELNRENKIAADQAAGKMAQANAVQAAQRIDAMLLRAQTHEQGALTTALKEYRESLDRIRAGSTTEDIDPRLSEDAIKRGEAAITKMHTQAVKGNDDRAKTLQDALIIQQTALESERSIYDAREKMLALYHSKFGTSDADFYAGRGAARAEYVAAEAIAFAKEAALIQSFKPKNAEEVAASKVRYDELLKLHQKFIDDMRTAGGDDSATAAASAKKSYDDIVKATHDAGVADIKRLDDQIIKQREHNAEIGKSKDQIDLARQAVVDLDTAQMQADADFIRDGMTKWKLDDQAIAVYTIRLNDLDEEIKRRRELAGLLGAAAILDADAKAAADASKAWKHAATTIENDLTNAILDGGGRGWKKLVHDMEFAFARMILSPILQPISGGIASYLNPLAAQAQAGAGTGMSSAISAAQSASSMYSAITNGFAGLSTSVADGVQAGMNAAGLSSNILTNGPVAQGFGAAAGAAAGIAAGKTIGSAISGDYGIGGHGSAVVNIGTAAGMFFGGPIGAAIGGTIAGLVNRAFGMGSEQVKGRTLVGSLGATGFTGGTDTAIHQDGGWFRSDKDFTRNTPADSTMSNALGSAYDQIKVASADFAKTLGLNADSIKDRAQSLSIALTDDKAANQKAITDFFTGVGNSMATELVPNLSDFAKAGEAASATLQRLAGDFQATDQFAAMLGKSASDVFGAVGIASATARERLIDDAGGSGALGQKTTAYMQNFYTDADKLAPVIKTVGEAMDSLGLASIKTKIDFKAQIDGMLKSGALGTADGAKLFANLMDLQGAFAQVADAADAATKASADKAAADKSAADALTASIAKEQRGLDIQLMTAMGDAEGALAATRKDALDAMLSDQARLTQQQIWAADAAAAAITKAQDAAKAQAAATASFGDALVGAMNNATAAAKALRAFNDSLKLGNLSPLSKAAQYDIAKQAYGANPADQASATAFLQASQARGGSKLDYARDFAAVIAGNSAQAAARDVSAAAIPAMWAAFNSMNGSHAGGLNYVPFDGYRAITHEGEGILTKAENKAYRAGGGSGGGMSEATARRLITAIEEGTKHSRKTADILTRVTQDGKSLLTKVAA